MGLFGGGNDRRDAAFGPCNIGMIGGQSRLADDKGLFQQIVGLSEFFFVIDHIHTKIV